MATADAWCQLAQFSTRALPYRTALAVVRFLVMNFSGETGVSLMIPAFAGSCQSQSNRSKQGEHFDCHCAGGIFTALAPWQVCAVKQPVCVGHVASFSNNHDACFVRLFAISACRCALFPTLGAAVFARSFEVNRCQTC